MSRGPSREFNSLNPRCGQTPSSHHNTSSWTLSSKQVTGIKIITCINWLIMSLCTIKFSELNKWYYSIFKNCKKYLKDNKHNSLHLVWKQALIFVLGHNCYLFLKALGKLFASWNRQMSMDKYPGIIHTTWRLLLIYTYVYCGIKFQTLCALVRAVYRKRLGDHGFDVINILIGFDAAEAQMQVFFYHL